jgi:hypothetical protein
LIIGLHVHTDTEGLTERIVFCEGFPIIHVGITTQERINFDRGGDVLAHSIYRLVGGGNVHRLRELDSCRKTDIEDDFGIEVTNQLLGIDIVADVVRNARTKLKPSVLSFVKPKGASISIVNL